MHGAKHDSLPPRSARATGEGEYWFDEAAAEHAVAFIEECCRHTKGEWYDTPFLLEHWQRDLIETLFGWKRPNGLRRYRRAYIEIPKKNGKSSLGAALALYLTFADGEYGAEVYSAAADREQAAIVFSTGKTMVELEPFLDERAHTFTRSISYPATRSVYKVLSSDVPTKHGLNWHGVVFDELHAQPNRELYDTLKGGGAARRQPLFIMFTTAGYDRSSICWEVHEYAVKVCDGVLDDDSFLALVFAADEADDWQSRETWAKANPNLGISPKLEYLDEQCREARESIQSQNTFRRLHLNQWTEQDTRWLDLDVWDDNADPLRELDGRECWGGLDLASTLDTCSLTLVFPWDDDTYDVLAFFWIPEDTATKRTQRERVTYDAWIKAGYMKATEGAVTDYDVIRADVNALGDRFDIREIACDPWQATQLMVQLEGDGFEVFAHRQGFMSLNAGSKALERTLVGRKLRHAGHPVLRWMASNVAVDRDAADNIKPSKKRSRERIDGIVSLVMALGRAQGEDASSVYDERGFDSVGGNS